MIHRGRAQFLNGHGVIARAVCAAVCAAFVLYASACGDAPPGRAPVVRIVLVPAFVPEGDGYQTTVVADGSTSADPFDDPNATRSFLFHWSIDDDGSEPMPNRDSARIEFRVGGLRPTPITLEIVDGDGRKASATVNVGITIAN